MFAELSGFPNVFGDGWCSVFVEKKETKTTEIWKEFRGPRHRADGRGEITRNAPVRHSVQCAVHFSSTSARNKEIIGEFLKRITGRTKRFCGVSLCNTYVHNAQLFGTDFRILPRPFLHATTVLKRTNYVFDPKSSRRVSSGSSLSIGQPAGSPGQKDTEMTIDRCCSRPTNWHSKVVVSETR